MKTGSIFQRTFLVSTSLDLSLKSFCVLILKAEVSANTVYCFENDLTHTHIDSHHTHTHNITHHLLQGGWEQGESLSNATFAMLVSLLHSRFRLNTKTCLCVKSNTESLNIERSARYKDSKIDCDI